MHCNNLVVFGHLHLVLCDSSHVGNARLPFSCVLQFTPDSASFVYLLLTSSSSFHYHLRILPHVDAIAPSHQNVHKRFITRSVPLFPPLSRILDRWHTETCRVFSYSGFDLNHFPFYACAIALSLSTIFSISVRRTAWPLFSTDFFLSVAHWCALCAIFLSWIVDFLPWDRSKYPLSSSADPSFSSRAEFFSPRKFPITHVP